ncbi:ATP-binding protein [Phaeodactylibacter sp.]|uniref:ATP-binding protein n=1 Tax=Phaeodactylibacter sp. TaxID=1940289 RepID=UPI0025F729DB|nr:ATP-binding protein [Phaeodactylibacter sp.]MCI4647106.1 ATP-binding protein [Phaeodactylibacter sp.]MCI5091064.1 ATP-binding protein [Phaeodactylibacter sp.]
MKNQRKVLRQACCHQRFPAFYVEYSQLRYVLFLVESQKNQPAIVKRIMDRHDGSMEVESSEEGQGSTFTRYFPLI